MRLSFLFLFVFIPLFLIGQVSQKDTRIAINALSEFVAIPNFGLNKSDIIKNIEWLENEFQKRKFTTKRLETEGNPLLLAQLEVDKAYPTILFYMHLDGQAVDPSKWDQDDPYKAVIKSQDLKGNWKIKTLSESDRIDPDWRIFGRSASDDKGPIIGFLTAMDHINIRDIKHNIKVIFDGEEELGSRPLAAAVVKYRELLSANALIINDGPVHTSGKPTLTFGCRGIMTLNMTVYGPVKPQHIHLAFVVHGASTDHVLNNEEYRNRYDTDNPNIPFIISLAKKGVQMYVCGQSATYRGIEKKHLIPEVKMALSAMTVLTTLQMDGYAMIRF